MVEDDGGEVEDVERFDSLTEFFGVDEVVGGLGFLGGRVGFADEKAKVFVAPKVFLEHANGRDNLFAGTVNSVGVVALVANLHEVASRVLGPDEFEVVSVVVSEVGGECVGTNVVFGGDDFVHGGLPLETPAVSPYSCLRGQG